MHASNIAVSFGEMRSGILFAYAFLNMNIFVMFSRLELNPN